MEKLIITPYKGAGSYELGSTQDEVFKNMGAANSCDEDEILVNVREQRGGVELLFSRPNVFSDEQQVLELEFIYIKNDVKALLDGVDVFESTLALLKEIDGDFVEGSYYSIFKTLGIAVGGFGKRKIPEGKIIQVFRRESLEYLCSYYGRS